MCSFFTLLLANYEILVISGLFTYRCSCMYLIFAYFNPDKNRVLPHFISVDTTVSLNSFLVICTHDVTCDVMNCAFVRLAAMYEVVSSTFWLQICIRAAKQSISGSSHMPSHHQLLVPVQMTYDPLFITAVIKHGDYARTIFSQIRTPSPPNKINSH